MVGILVHGDNDFIVRGPLPDRDAARALIRHWSINSDWSDNRTLAHLDNRCTASLGSLLSKVSLLTRSGSLN